MMKKNHTTMTIASFFWGIIKPYRFWYALMLQAPIVSALYLFANNYSLKLLIDAFSAENIVYNHLVYPIVLFISAQILLESSWRICNFAVWRTQPFVQEKIILDAYEYTQYHSYSYFQNTQSGSIISKLKGILDGYNSIFANSVYKIGKNFCVVVVSIGVLLLVNKAVSFYMLLWCAIVMIILYPMTLKLNKFSNDAAESKHRAIGLLADNITNIFSLLYFSKRKQELKRAAAFMSNEYIPCQMAMEKYNFKFQVVGSLLYWVMLISVLLFMVFLRLKGDVSTGGFLFVMLTTIFISFDFWMLITGLSELMKEIGDLRSSFTLLSTAHTESDSSAAKDIPRAQGNIEFKHVSFVYDNAKKVFSKLDLSIRAGEKLGIIGHSGAGKSTLISLLLKNFKPTSGAILLDGLNIAEITADSLREQIALIPKISCCFTVPLRTTLVTQKKMHPLRKFKLLLE